LDTELPSKPLLLHGDYEYLGEGYYACTEVDGSDALPTPADILDAYVVPIALERARLAGLPIPEWHLTNEHFEAPALLYGVNPFARSHELVREGDDLRASARKLSRQGKFVLCCQSLPADADVVEFEMILGRSTDPRFSTWASDIFEIFRLPLALVRLIETDGQFFLSAIERLPRDEMSDEGQALLERQLTERGEIHE
jgi:hypothetical protein